MTPRTEAGKRLLDWLDDERGPLLFDSEERRIVKGLRAIEAEAVAAYKARLVKGVEGLPHGGMWLLDRAAVLRLIEETPA